MSRSPHRKCLTEFMEMVSIQGSSPRDRTRPPPPRCTVATGRRPDFGSGGFFYLIGAGALLQKAHDITAQIFLSLSVSRKPKSATAVAQSLRCPSLWGLDGFDVLACSFNRHGTLLLWMVLSGCGGKGAGVAKQVFGVSVCSGI